MIDKKIIKLILKLRKIKYQNSLIKIFTITDKNKKPNSFSET